MTSFTDLSSSGAYLDASFSAIAGRECRPVYAMNLTARSARLPTYLRNALFNIHPGIHPTFKRSVGINVPTYYLARRLAFTELHIEDGDLDSCNVMHCEEPGAVKLWLFIDPQSFPELCSWIREALPELLVRGEDVPHREGCSFPFHHKNLVLAPTWLKAMNIQFQVVAQRPGTLIYVREGVLHQVLNTGLNLAEAVSVGGPGWNHLAHIFAPCGCEDFAVVTVPLNPNSYEIIKSYGARSHTCPHPGCLQTSVSAAHSRLHARTHDSGASSRAPHGCYLCSAVYATEGHLRNHLRNQHPDGTARDERVYPGCNRVYNSRSIAKYKRGCAALAAGPTP